MFPCGFWIFVIDLVVGLEYPIDAEAADQHIPIRGKADFVLPTGPGLGRHRKEPLNKMFGARILNSFLNVENFIQI
jgi:hypothetical protein